MTDPQATAQVVSRKVKAHRKIKDAKNDNDLKQILGNKAADSMADKCISDQVESYHGINATAIAKGLRKGTKDMVRLLDQARTELGVPPKPLKSIKNWSRQALQRRKRRSIIRNGKRIST